MKLQIPTPSPDAQASSKQLTRLIQQEILENNNWITFSRFMELALYTPQLGYYSGGSHKIGKQGDFITAPTLTPLFGQSLARQLTELLPQTSGNLYEFGAGTGNLAVTLLNCLSDGINHYYIIELSAELAERQRALISENTSPEQAIKVIHLSEIPESLDGIIIGNEVLDAMPIELIKHENNIWQHVGVSLQNNSLTQSSRPLLNNNLQNNAIKYFPPAPQPYVSELHPTQYAFIHTLAQKLKRGCMIFIDYGFDSTQYYHPQRNMGTLIGHYRHHTIHDPFFNIGLTDLTAHVNFTDIAQAGVDAGLDLIGYSTQANFLLNCGLTELLAQYYQINTPIYAKATSAAQQLINPHEMGELFKVIAFGKNIDVDWIGFKNGDICHKL